MCMKRDTWLKGALKSSICPNNNFDVNIKWARNISQTNLSSLLSVATQSSAIKDWHAMYINPRVLFVMF